MINSAQQQTATLTSKLLKNWPTSGKKQSEQQSIVVSKKQPELSPSIAKLVKPKEKAKSQARTASKVANPEIDGYKIFELAQMEYPFDQLNKEGDFLVVKEEDQHPKFFAGIIVTKEEMTAKYLKGALNLGLSLVPVSGLLFRAFIRKGRVVVPRENIPTSVNIALTGFEIK